MAAAETKFTPGPWVQFVGEDGDVIEILPAGRPGHIATVGLCEPRFADEVDANSHLIAATPELYEMTVLLERSLLYEIGKSRDAGDDEGARLKHVTLVMVRDLLAKARGDASASQSPAP